MIFPPCSLNFAQFWLTLFELLGLGEPIMQGRVSEYKLTFSPFWLHFFATWLAKVQAGFAWLDFQPK